VRGEKFFSARKREFWRQSRQNFALRRAAIPLGKSPGFAERKKIPSNGRNFLRLYSATYGSRAM